MKRNLKKVISIIIILAFVATMFSFTFAAEAPKPDVGNITITNNDGKTADKVAVSGITMSGGWKIKVYDSTGTKLLKTSANIASGSTSGDVSFVLPAVKAGDTGRVQVSIVGAGKGSATEGQKTAKDYACQTETTALTTDQVTVKNNYEIDDIITVTGRTAGDVVKAYTGTGSTFTLVASAKATGATVAVKVKKGKLAGTPAVTDYLYVSVTSIATANKIESRYTGITYAAEATSDAPTQALLVDVEGTGKDLLVIYGLAVGDIVNVYKGASDTTVAAKATVAKGSTYVAIAAASLSTNGSSVYVTVTSKGKKVSSTGGTKTTIPVGVTAAP